MVSSLHNRRGLDAREWLAILGVLVVACGSPSAPSSVSTSNPSSVAPVTSVTTLPGMAEGERLPGSDLWALVARNDPGADRINLVFAPWGWDEEAAFVDYVRQAISWTGDAYLIQEDGYLTASRQEAWDAGLGPFGIEPWRSARDSFNVWYTDREPGTPVAWLMADDQPFAIGDVVMVTVAIDAQRFNPDLASVAGQDTVFVGPGIPRRPISGNPFAHVVLVVDRAFPAAAAVELPHELGHAMFNLADEYVGEVLGFDGRTDLSSWPSCAEDFAEAIAWWADLVGEVDPMLTMWEEEMAEAGFPLPDSDGWAERVVVGAVDGGCYDVAGSARATVDSLMNTSIPVLGSVNRRWSEEILDLWEGLPR